MLDVIFAEDIQASLLAGLVLACKTARAMDGSNVEFLSGAMVAFQHTALTFKVPWGIVLDQARVELGHDLAGLLDAAQGGLLETGS